MPKRHNSSPYSDLVAALRALKRAKLHVAPEISSRGQRVLDEHFANAWEPVERLALALTCFPAGLIRFWADQPRGHILIRLEDRGYLEGEQVIGNRVLDGVAHMALRDVASGSGRGLVLAACIIDHLLGSEGAATGPRLSDGEGITAHWREVGQRVQELFQLGYGRSEEERRDVRAYFSRGVANYCLDRRSLNVRDPGLERLLARSLMSQEMWCR